LLWLDKLTNILVLVLLIKITVAAGLGGSLDDLVSVLRNAPLLISAGLANYVVVPAIFSLLYAFRANPMVALGFLMVGSVRVLRLQLRLQRWPKAMSRFPWLNGRLRGVFSDSGSPSLAFSFPVSNERCQLENRYRQNCDDFADTPLAALDNRSLGPCETSSARGKIKKPANLISAGLSRLVFTLIIILQYRTLTEVHAKGYLRICLLVLLCLAAGWILGSQPVAVRTAMSMTTAARNVRVALVIATVRFSDTAAVTAVIVFSIFQTILLGLCALF
jgi:hypothetical protein